MENGKMEDVVTVRLSRELKDAVQEKADREAVNVSQLVRNFLEGWVVEKPPGKQGEA